MNSLSFFSNKHPLQNILHTMDPTKAQTTAAFAYLKSQKANKVGAPMRATHARVREGGRGQRIMGGLDGRQSVSTTRHGSTGHGYTPMVLHIDDPFLVSGTLDAAELPRRI